MIWNLAIAALATTSIVSLLAGFLGERSRPQKEYHGPLHAYLLANQGLGQLSVIQLLFSTSFSLNGMLYQIWLGYSIGIWALFVQGAWAFSYVLLAHYVKQIREATSLHAFLDSKFGDRTRWLAGLCSIIGFTIMVGWEFNVGKSTFEGFFSLQPGQSPSQNLVLVFMLATVFVSFLYTAIGGLRSNAIANRVQNVIKVLVFILMIWLLYQGMRAMGTTQAVWTALFPSMSHVIANLGIFGLITNLAFSLIWQFVDMSTWHSVIASRERLNTKEARNALRMSGLAVFFAPGILGTLLGVFLAGTAGITPNNVMIKLVSLLPSDNLPLFLGLSVPQPVLLFMIFVALLLSFTKVGLP